MKNLEYMPKYLTRSSLKDDMFRHIDDLYQEARDDKDYGVALKALELCLKAKQALSHKDTPITYLKNLSDSELSHLLTELESESPVTSSERETCHE